MSNSFKNMMIFFLSLSIGIDVYASSEPPSDVHEAVLQEAETLLRGGQSENAFTLLDEYAGQLEGIVEYDYLYGLSALQTGNPSIAIFALERASALSPRSGTIILDLARAYFDGNDLPQAQAMFERARALNPPAAIMQIIDQYQAEIAIKLSPFSFEFDLLAGLTVGNDSNANSGTAEREVKFHDGFYTLNPQSRQSPSDFFVYNGQSYFAIDWKKQVKLFSSASLAYSQFSSAKFADNASGALKGGLSYSGSRFFSNNLATVQIVQMRKSANQNTNNSANDAENKNIKVATALLVSDQQINFSETFAAAIFGYAGLSMYPKLYEVQEGYFGVAGARSTFRNGLNTLSVSLSGGRHVPTNNDSLFGNVFVNMDANVNSYVAKNAKMYLNGSIKYSNYQNDVGNALSFGAERVDALARVSAGFTINYSKKWTISPELSLIKTKSTVDLYEYEKLKVSVSIQTQVL
ncbi:MAG: tetratricopeptide repeat protein [Gammaproteobacteria bacterium]|nr:tetratricopeptide repeat protein [Gammaproteobacteria bacterium]